MAATHALSEVAEALRPNRCGRLSVGAGPAAGLAGEWSLPPGMRRPEIQPSCARFSVYRRSGPRFRHLRPRPRRRATVPGCARMLSYPRQQQYRRLARAGVSSTVCAAAILLSLLAELSGVPQVGGLLLLAAVAIGLRARHWSRLAARAGVGARSERQSHHARRRPLRSFDPSVGPDARRRTPRASRHFVPDWFREPARNVPILRVSKSPFWGRRGPKLRRFAGKTGM